MPRLTTSKLLRHAWFFLAIVVLGLVFATYLRPSFILDLANRFVMC